MSTVWATVCLNLSLGSRLRTNAWRLRGVLVGYFAEKTGVPIATLVVATNENDILDRFRYSSAYSKKPIHGPQDNGGFAEHGAKAHEEGTSQPFNPAMNIPISSFRAFALLPGLSSLLPRVAGSEAEDSW